MAEPARHQPSQEAPARVLRANTVAGEDVGDFVHDQLGFVKLYANLAQGFVEAGDMAGLNYAMKHVIARVKACAGAINDLARETPSQ